MKTITVTTLALLCASASAFVIPTQRTTFLTTETCSSLYMAGFGGGSSKKTGGKKGKGKGKGPVTQKLKPKSQWDKYKRFKKSSSVKVAVRVAADAESDAGDWYEVGKIKSDGDEFTELAVVLQRGIIAEVC